MGSIVTHLMGEAPQWVGVWEGCSNHGFNRLQCILEIAHHCPETPLLWPEVTCHGRVTTPVSSVAEERERWFFLPSAVLAADRESFTWLSTLLAMLTGPGSGPHSGMQNWNRPQP